MSTGNSLGVLYRDRAPWQLWLSVVVSTTIAAFAAYSMTREYDPLWLVLAILGAGDAAIAAIQLVRRRASRERIPSGER